jgi:hypothetical protein
MVSGCASSKPNPHDFIGVADVDSKFSNQGRMLGQKLIIRFESQRNILGNTKGLCGAKI